MRSRHPSRLPAGGQSYIPALRFHWLTPVYDPVLRWTFPERPLKRHLVAQIGSPTAVLDVGCGTGTLALMLHGAQPLMRVTGIDVDAAVLARARRKALAAGARSLAFVQGSATQVPFDDASFDCVVSSLVIHHLTTANKLAAFRECFRVLRADGTLLLADFAAPRTLYARLIVPLVRNLEEVDDNMRGRLPGLVAEAGFADIQALAHFGSVLGTLTIYRAFRP